jgi:DNA-binding transcriptional MerR regulator
MTGDNIRHLPHIGIGEAVRLYGMTPRAIRFYDEKGLVTSRRDRLNHRYYDHEARQRLAWIGSLRRAGLSLDEIRSVLMAADEARHSRALALLAERRRGLEAELGRMDVVLDDLQAPRPERLTATR